MKGFDILKLIKKMVQKQSLDATLVKASKDNPFASLILFLGSDKEERPFLLNISSEEQILNPKKEAHLFRISFNLKLPFKIKDFSLSQVSNLIALLNHYLDLPGLEMNEVENELFYRYVLLVDKKGMSEELILGIIGMIKFILDVHIPSIEAVANGEISYDQLLKSALKVK